MRDECNGIRYLTIRDYMLTSFINLNSRVAAVEISQTWSIIFSECDLTLFSSVSSTFHRRLLLQHTNLCELIVIQRIYACCWIYLVSFACVMENVDKNAYLICIQKRYKYDTKTCSSTMRNNAYIYLFDATIM